MKRFILKILKYFNDRIENGQLLAQQSMYEKSLRPLKDHIKKDKG